MLNDIKHNGCFFHFLKNIRTFLMKNGFTKKENEKHYHSIKIFSELIFLLIFSSVKNSK